MRHSFRRVSDLRSDPDPSADGDYKQIQRLQSELRLVAPRQCSREKQGRLALSSFRRRSPIEPRATEQGGETRRRQQKREAISKTRESRDPR